MRRTMVMAIMRVRRVIVILIHVLLIAVSNYAAFLLRFDGSIPDVHMGPFLRMLPWLLVIRAAAFVPFRLYEGLWRYTSIWDLRNIIGAVVVSSGCFYAAVRFFARQPLYPRSIFFIDALLLICFMSGVRLMRRIYREFDRVDRHKRVLVFGAGDAGEMIVRDMKNNSFYDYEPIGFVDDDRRKIGRRIHGVPVLGDRTQLERIVTETDAHEILIAMPRADTATVRGVVKALERFKLPIMTLPNLRDVLGGRVSVEQIRSLAIDDLIVRAPVGLERTSLRQLVEDKRVLVTGAGGSIGSELCRQILALQPCMLVLYERYENGLYAIDNELARIQTNSIVQPLIGDVTDARRVNDAFAEYLPDIVFHAAAHKHVPLMEANVCEAVKNNVIGTRTVAEAAARHGIGRFILISTDKAVRPSSIMGATKHIAELLVRAISRHSSTTFVAVRFGNVLGTNGSVVPMFMEQIKAGGPVTVTHPEVRRYFMLIREAVELVLHAAAVGEPGAVYVLNMGEQIRVVDMARNLIRLSGFVPDDDIQIEFIGLRPGEKMFEELTEADEELEPAVVDKVMRVRRDGSEVDERLFWTDLAHIESLALEGDGKGVIEQLKRMVRTFRPLGE